MRVPVRFRFAAREELLAAAEWYEDRRPGLGIEFVAEVDQAIGQISLRPEAWPLWVPPRPYRKFVLERFPYIVFFVSGADGVEVLAVAHARKRPGYWLRREG